MSDFFAQLAARHRGEAAALRPHLPSRFEPVSASLAAADLTGETVAGAGPVLAGGLGPGGLRPDGPDLGDLRPGRLGPGGMRSVRLAGPGWGQAADGERGVGAEPWDGAWPDGTWPDGTAAADGAMLAERPPHQEELVRRSADQANSGPGLWADGTAAGRVTRMGAAGLAAETGAADWAAKTGAADWAAKTGAAETGAARLAVSRPGARGTVGARSWPGQLGAARPGQTRTGAEGAGSGPDAAGPGPGARPRGELAAWGDAARAWGSAQAWSSGQPGSGVSAAEADFAAGPDGGPSGARPAVLRPARLPGAWPGDTGLRPVPVGQPAALGRRRVWPGPGRAAGGPSGPGQDSITVQVTIGRVEVRAAPPAGRAAAERPASTRGAGPSLADYLRHRSRSAGARP